MIQTAKKKYMNIVTDKSTTLRIPMHISTDSLSEPQNSISSMENNKMHLETEPETQGRALGNSEIMAEIREMAEDINRSLTETQWRQQLDAPASTTGQNSWNQEQIAGRADQTENGAEMGKEQYPPTHPDYTRRQQNLIITQNSMAPTVTVTTALPREYIYPDIGNRQQNILTRSTPAYHSPIVTAEIQRKMAFTAPQPTQTLVAQPWVTTGTPGAPTHQLPSINRYGVQNTGYSYGAPVSAPDGHTPLPRNNGDVRFHIIDDTQTPQRPTGNTEQTRDGTREQRQNGSDTGSDQGSDNSNASIQERTEARKAFRHVMKAVNPEKFSGDKKQFRLWKITLENEVEDIDMTSSRWMKLLLARTESEALEIAQEARMMSEVWGTDTSVTHI